MYVVSIRGAIAFQIDFTFSKETGLRLCGIVDDPTCSVPKDSATSPISLRWSCRMSSARLAITPSALTQECARSVHPSGGTICVETGAAWSCRLPRNLRSEEHTSELQ